MDNQELANGVVAGSTQRKRRKSVDRFTLTIDLGNDAMYRGNHIADALRKLAERIECSHYYDLKVDGGKIMDVNGNSVGNWEVR